MLPEALFSGCLWVCLCIPLLTQYLEKCWTYLHQINIAAFWDKDECIKFGVKRSKFKVMVGPNMLKKHFLALLMWYLESRLNFAKLSTLKHSGTKINTSGFGSKDQRSRSQHEKGLIGWRNRAGRCTSSSHFWFDLSYSDCFTARGWLKIGTAQVQHSVCMPVLCRCSPLWVFEHSSSCCCSSPYEGTLLLCNCICCVGWCIDTCCWFT